MAEQTDLEFDPGKEGAFRRGYLRGVKAALEALDSRFSDQDRIRLGYWNSALVAWHGSNASEYIEPPGPEALDG